MKNNGKYSASDVEWLKENKAELPRMRKRSKNTFFAGTLSDLIQISDNPRKGSDVYIGDEFTIVLSVTEWPIAPMIGAPQMPIQQWIRNTPKKENQAAL